MEKLQDIELKKMLTELADMLQTVYQEKLKAVILYGVCCTWNSYR